MDGNATDNNQSVPYPTYAYARIAHTFFHQPDANGGFRFSGMVLTDGGSPALGNAGHSDKQRPELLRLCPLARRARSPNPGIFNRPYRTRSRNDLLLSGLCEKRGWREPGHPEKTENPGSNRSVSLVGPDALRGRWLEKLRLVQTFECKLNANWIYHGKTWLALPVPDDEQGLWLWTQDRGYGVDPNRAYSPTSGPTVTPVGYACWEHRKRKPVFWDYLTGGLNH